MWYHPFVSGDSGEILFLSPALEYSAATLYTLTLASALVARDVPVLVITPGGRFEKTFRDRNVPLKVEPHLERRARGWPSRRQLLRELAERAPRLLHVQATTAASLGAALGWRLGIRAILTVHRYYDPRRPIEIDWRAFSAVITHGGDLRADVVNRRRAPKDLVHVVPSGVEAGPECRPPFARPGAAPVIGTLGEVERAEMHRDFVAAAKAVVAKVPDAQFLIVGEGADPRVLRATIRDLDLLSHFTFANVIDHRRVLPEMDICVMPSVKEGGGHAILEAMAAGRPVIAAGGGGAFEVIRHEATGLLVDTPGPAGLADAVLRLLLDRALAQRMGLRAREVVLERYPLERMVDETLGIYARAAAAVPARG
jgi:glycosyltransferase involved in cell wall biosynthesis